MSTWNKEHDPWVLSLDSQSVTLNTSGTYVPVDLEIDVISGSSGTLSGNSASVDSISVTTGSSYFTSTATAQEVVVRADASSGAVTLSGFSAGWISTGVAGLSGDSTSDSETLYIKNVSTGAAVITDSTYGTEVIDTAGWIDSLKISGIAPSGTSLDHPFTVAGNPSAVGNFVQLESTTASDAVFVITGQNVGDLNIVGGHNNIDSINIDYDGDNYQFISGGVLQEVQFKQGTSTIAGNSITITGPSDPITVSGNGWNSATKTVTINLSTTTINASGETTLSQISPISSGGTDYLAFSASTGAVVSTPGYVAAGTTAVADSSVNSGIPYYDGTINH